MGPIVVKDGMNEEEREDEEDQAGPESAEVDGEGKTTKRRRVGAKH